MFKTFLHLSRLLSVMRNELCCGTGMYIVQKYSVLIDTSEDKRILTHLIWSVMKLQQIILHCISLDSQADREVKSATILASWYRFQGNKYFRMMLSSGKYVYPAAIGFILAIQLEQLLTAVCRRIEVGHLAVFQRLLPLSP